MEVKDIVRLLLKHSNLVITLFFIMASVMFVYALSIPIDPSFSSLISDDTEYNINERILANVLGAGDFAEVFFKPDDTTILEDRPRYMDEEEVLDYIARVADVLSESPYVKSIQGPEINDDRNYARLLLSLESPRSIRGFREVIDDLDRYFEDVSSYPGVQSTLTGTPLLFNRVNSLLINDNIRTIGFSIIAVFIILWLYFKNIKYTIITMSIPLISLIILGGIMTLATIPITITLAIVGILIVGLGVDFAIHVIVSYESYREAGYKHKESILESIDHLHIAVIGSFLTTVAGFASLMFGVSPSSQSQGLVLAISITLVTFTTITLLPPLIYVFGDIKKIPKKIWVFDWIKERLGELALTQTDNPKKILTIIAVVTVIMGIGAANVGFDTGNDNWIPPDDPIQESFRESAYAFESTFSSLTMVIRGDNLLDIQTARDMQELERSLLADSNIEDVRTPYSGISLRRQDIISNLDGRFNEDNTLGRGTIQVGSFAVEEGGSSAILDNIRQTIDENPVYGTEITLFGDVVRFNELGASLGRDTGVTTAISLIVVFIIASVLYLSFKSGVIALLPVIIGIIWTVGFMGFFGVPFTSISTGLIALVLGTGVDFSIHLTNSTKNHIAEGDDLKSAIHHTMIYSGRALLLTSITTFIGFSSLVLADLLGIQRLGLSLAFSILSVFLVTIMMVPAILSITMRNEPKTQNS